MMSCNSEPETSHWMREGLSPALSHFAIAQTKQYHGVPWSQSESEHGEKLSATSKVQLASDCSIITSVHKMQSSFIRKSSAVGDSKASMKGNWSPYFSSSLSVVSEDMPWDSFSGPKPLHEEDNASSSSSIGCDSGVSSLSTSEDASGDAEVQSSYTGPLGSLSCLEDALPFKRGLSGFFNGKSKSFSCLADVSSVKELAKPDTPYSKRRRYLTSLGNSSRSRFHSIHGCSGIIKKNSHSNSKCSLSLALALSSEDVVLETEEQHSPSSWKRKSLPARSYSLTDLQRA